MPTGIFLDYVDPWVNWEWLSTHITLITDALQQHLLLTAIAVGGGLALSLPLAIPAQSDPRCLRRRLHHSFAGPVRAARAVHGTWDRHRRGGLDRLHDPHPGSQ